MNVFKLCESMGMTQKHQKFLKDVIVELLKEGSKNARKRSFSIPIITLLKSLQNNHD